MSVKLLQVQIYRGAKRITKLNPRQREYKITIILLTNREV